MSKEIENVVNTLKDFIEKHGVIGARYSSSSGIVEFQVFEVDKFVELVDGNSVKVTEHDEEYNQAYSVFDGARVFILLDENDYLEFIDSGVEVIEDE